MSNDTLWRPSDRQLTSRIGEEELVLLHLDSGAYFGLDQVGAFVWEHLQAHAPVSLADLVAVVVAHYRVESDRCRRELGALMEDLHAEGLVERIES